MSEPPPAPPGRDATAAAPNAYPKAARLRTENDFRRARSRNRKAVGGEIVVRVSASGRPSARLGVASPKWYGNAVRRNRFRRLVREAFRFVARRLPPMDLVVEPRRDLVEPTLAGIERDLLAAVAGRPR